MSKSATRSAPTVTGAVTTKSLSASAARRTILAAQGFGGERTLDADALTWRKLKPALQGMQALQIDAINTINRSHYMPLYSRLGSYSRDTLDHNLFNTAQQSRSKRTFFEYWGHECSLMPLDLFPLLQWRMEDAQNHAGIYKQCTQIAKRRPDLIKNLKATIAARGPLSSRELESSKRGPGMWEWSDTKKGLEYLFWTGEITTRGRRRFERLYDLTENSIPSKVLEKCNLQRHDAQMELLYRSVVALGIGTEADIRDYFRLSAVEAKAAINGLLEDKRIERVDVEGWQQVAYRTPQTKTPRKISHSTFLTPFDPLVWNRKRLQRLFDFNYRIEIYVPQAKRKYGYYVLPFLHDDRLIARLDMKSDRDKGYLQVLGLWWEDAVPNDAPDVLQQELTRLADWLDLEGIKWSRSARAKLRKATAA